MAKRWMIQLPSVMTKNNRFIIMALAVLYSTFIYTTSNFNPVFTPQLLPEQWIDKVTPFIPESFWIYVTEYFLFLWAMFRFSDVSLMDRYLYGFLSLQTFCVLIFLVFPTTFPRDLYPIPETTDWLTRAAFEGFRRNLDSPNNCLPSLHVASCFLTAFAFFHCKKWEFIVALVWASLIGISTMFTKQHYFVDVAAGLALAVLFYWITYHRVIYYRLGGSQARR